MMLLQEALVTAASCDRALRDQAMSRALDGTGLVLFTIFAGFAAALIVALCHGYFSRWSRAKRRRDRAVTDRAVQYMAIGLRPGDAWDRASNELAREAVEVLSA